MAAGVGEGEELAFPPTPLSHNSQIMLRSMEWRRVNQGSLVCFDRKLQIE
jgi:hypothetical protein